MECEQVRVDIAAYAFGGLDPDDWRAVTRHLAGCRACREEHSGYAGLVDLMAAVRPWEVEPGAPRCAPGPEQARAAARAARRRRRD